MLIFQNKRMKNAQFNLFYHYMLLLTEMKQLSNLQIIKEIGATLLAVICP